MQVTKLRVDGQVFFLPADTDITALKAAIIAAIRSGSDFVDFLAEGHGKISVLMTPQIPVRFESVERSAEEIESWQSEPPSFELDAADFFD